MSRDDRAVVALIPGMGNTPSLWQAQREALAGQYEVVVPDYRGCRTVREMTDSVVACLPGSPVAIAGFSLGGYIALDIVRRLPRCVSRLALISTSPYADGEEAKKQRHRLIEKARHDYESVLIDMAQFVVHARGAHAEAARSAVIAMGVDLGAEEFCGQQLATMDRPDCSGWLGEIRVPVRVLCGTRDRITPTAGNRVIADRIPGATLEIVADAGHVLPLESPGRVTAFLLDWMAG